MNAVQLGTVSSHHHTTWREIVFHTHARIPAALGKDFVAKLAKNYLEKYDVP